MYNFSNGQEFRAFLSRELVSEEQVKNMLKVVDSQLIQIIERKELEPIYMENGQKFFLRREVEEREMRLH